MVQGLILRFRIFGLGFGLGCLAAYLVFGLILDCGTRFGLRLCFAFCNQRGFFAVYVLAFLICQGFAAKDAQQHKDGNEGQNYNQNIERRKFHLYDLSCLH